MHKCLCCASTTTYLETDGRERWVRNYDEAGNVLCWNCYKRLRYQKKTMPIKYLEFKECHACGTRQTTRWIMNKSPVSCLLLCRNCFALIFETPFRNKEQYNEYARDYYNNHKVELRPTYRIRNRVNRIKCKKEMLDFLGSKCNKCGITDIRLLDFDHINGGGRKIQTKTQTNVIGILYKLFKQDPEKFKQEIQLLCCNDNRLKRFECNEVPHSKEYMAILGISN